GVAGSTEVLRPAPIGLLQGEQALGHLRIEIGALPPEQPIEEDVLRLHRHVGLERRVPVAVRVLDRRRVPNRGRDRRVYPGRSRPRALVTVDQDDLPFRIHHVLILPPSTRLRPWRASPLLLPQRRR